MFETVVRDGVVLKPLETWHAGEFAEHMSRAREHIRPWVGPTFVTDTVDGARATLQRYATATANDGARIYGLWDEGKIVGGVMFVALIRSGAFARSAAGSNPMLSEEASSPGQSNCSWSGPS